MVIFGNYNDPTNFDHFRRHKTRIVIADKHHAGARVEVDGHAVEYIETE